MPSDICQSGNLQDVVPGFPERSPDPRGGVTVFLPDVPHSMGDANASSRIIWGSDVRPVVEDDEDHGGDQGQGEHDRGCLAAERPEYEPIHGRKRAKINVRGCVSTQ